MNSGNALLSLITCVVVLSSASMAQAKHGCFPQIIHKLEVHATASSMFADHAQHLQIQDRESH
jgi:hypothetical protein